MHSQPFRTKLAAFVSALFIGGCASTSIGGGGLNLHENTLTVPLGFNQSANDAARYRREVGLYELYPDSVGTNSTSMVHAPPTFMRTQPRQYYVIRPQPIAVTRVDGRTAQFSLPETFNGGSACYVVATRGSARALPVNAGRPLTLSAFKGSTTTRDWVESRRTILASKRNALQQHVSGVAQANASLGSNPAYQNGQCVQPAMRTLPARPDNAYTASQASRLADEMIYQHLMNRALAGGGSCAEFVDWIRNGSPLGSLGEFAVTHTCAYRELDRSIYPVDELSPIVDFIEDRYRRCAARDEDFACLLVMGTIIAARWSIDKERIVERLTGPLRVWNARVARLRAEPGRLLEQCTADLARVNGGPAQTASLETEISEWEAELERAQVTARNNTAQRASQIFSAGDLTCSRPFSDFLSHNPNRRIGAR